MSCATLAVATYGRISLRSRQRWTYAFERPTSAGTSRLRRRERLRVQADRLLVGLAVDRGHALADAARIEGDDVEAVAERGEEVDAECLEIADRSRPRATEVEEQRADATLCLHGMRPGKRNLDRRAVGPGVVAWHFRRRTFDVDAVVAAGRPVEGRDSLDAPRRQPRQRRVL